MNKNEQGVLQQCKTTGWLAHILLLLSLFLTHHTYAERAPVDILTAESEQQKHNVYIIYSPEYTLHSDIIEKVSAHLNTEHYDISAFAATNHKKIKTVNPSTDIIIAIGSKGIRSIDRDYPNARKLFISTDPNKFSLDPKKNKNDAILYMTQSYCRQIRFIKSLNMQWKSISIINSQEKPVDRTTQTQCANKYDLKIFYESTSSEENLTGKIKNALYHSDVLLALPDSNIYNSKTVKNILLTSYRHRKPIIAFSKSFVNAGALASIHSTTGQIAQSAGKLIEQYFKSGGQFIKAINYPDDFNININRQVFRALDLPVPDVDKLKQSLQYPVQNDNIEPQ